MKFDDNMRPEVLKSMDYGFKKTINPMGLYVNEADDSGLQPLPVVFSVNSPNQDSFENPDIEDLYAQGWQFPEINKI